MFLTLMAFTSCGGGKYDDVKKTVDKMVKETDKFVSALDKADDAKAVTKAINSYNSVMVKAYEDFNKLEEKYPELGGTAPPEELKDTMAKMEGMAQSLMGASVKLIQYAMDPEVAEAMGKMAF